MANTSELGKLIGGIASDQARLQENVYPDDPSAQLQVLQGETIAWSESGTIIAGVIGSSSFYIDHPVYGDIDSSTLHIDGAYASTSTIQNF